MAQCLVFERVRWWCLSSDRQSGAHRFDLQPFRCLGWILNRLFANMFLCHPARECDAVRLRRPDKKVLKSFVSLRQSYQHPDHLKGWNEYWNSYYLMYATTTFRGFYKWCYEQSVFLITFYVQICTANGLLDIGLCLSAVQSGLPYSSSVWCFMCVSSEYAVIVFWGTDISFSVDCGVCR